MSKTARKKFHPLTGKVRRMLASTNDRMMWDVLPDSHDISDRLRKADSDYPDSHDNFRSRLVAWEILDRHAETMADAVREEAGVQSRRFNPYRTTP